MKNSNIIIIILLGLLLSSCLSKIEIEVPDPLIEKEIMLEILCDIHRAEGILKIPDISTKYRMKDSVEVYMEIIEKYNYSKEEFDKNIDYYFVARSKEMESMYETILERISGMEDENTKNTAITKNSVENLWNQKGSYRLPDSGTSNPIEFSIPIDGKTGTYTFRYRALVHKDDQSDSLCTNIFFWYDDGTEEGKTLAWDTHYYGKDGRSHSLNFDKKLRNPEYTHIKGRLLHHKVKSGHWEMHSTISGISLTYTPDKEEDQKSSESKAGQKETSALYHR